MAHLPPKDVDKKPATSFWHYIALYGYNTKNQCTMKTLQNYILVGLTAIGLTGCQNTNADQTEIKSFDKTLKIHLDAIRQGNLAALDPTVADSVTLISPSGEIMKTKKAFMKLHEEWFKLKNWEWSATMIKTKSNDSLGYTSLQYTFTLKDPRGKNLVTNKNYLLLIFKNSKYGWQLVHDQNTPIK